MASGNFFDFQQKVARKRLVAPAPAAPPSAEPLTVSQVTAKVDRVLKSGMPPVLWVKGELSNYKRNAFSGHHYFTLKDPAACLDCVMFRDEGDRLKFTPTDGLEMLATGRIGVYAQRGRYQLYVSALEPLGQGALELAFQQLRMKLEAEGLFEAGRKKPLPNYPSRIVIVTSSQTAALQDVLKVLRRFSWVRLFVYHVPVQGDAAGDKIAAALTHLNRTAHAAGGADLILLVRGGGSLEDLWCFNEERVARAIAASGIPVVTGIGHEVDTSIADLVADHWAHTPTEAAQVVTRLWRGAGEGVELSGERLRRAVRALVQDARRRLAAVERHETFRRPTDRVNGLRQLLDDRQKALALGMSGQLRALQWRMHALQSRLEQNGPSTLLSRLRARLDAADHRLTQGGARKLLRASARLATLAALLGGRHPRHRVRLQHERIEALAARLARAVASATLARSQRLDLLARHLQAVGPEQVLRRGYSITLRKSDGAVLRGAREVCPGDRLVTRFADGQVESVADDPARPRLFE